MKRDALGALWIALLWCLLPVLAFPLLFPSFSARVWFRHRAKGSLSAVVLQRITPSGSPQGLFLKKRQRAREGKGREVEGPRGGEGKGREGGGGGGGGREMKLTLGAGRPSRTFPGGPCACAGPGR